jgi:hypothetical protein
MSVGHVQRGSNGHVVRDKSGHVVRQGAPQTFRVDIRLTCYVYAQQLTASPLPPPVAFDTASRSYYFVDNSVIFLGIPQAVATINKTLILNRASVCIDPPLCLGSPGEAGCPKFAQLSDCITYSYTTYDQGITTDRDPQGFPYIAQDVQVNFSTGGILGVPTTAISYLPGSDGKYVATFPSQINFINDSNYSYGPTVDNFFTLNTSTGAIGTVDGSGPITCVEIGLGEAPDFYLFYPRLNSSSSTSSELQPSYSLTGLDGSSPVTMTFPDPSAQDLQNLWFAQSGGAFVIAYAAGTITITPICDDCVDGSPVIDLRSPQFPVCYSCSSSSTTTTTCAPFCQFLGSSGSFIAPFDGTLYLLYNDINWTDNTGSFTGTFGGTSVTVSGDNYPGVPIPVTAGTSYSYSFTGSINNGSGYITGPNGDGTIGQCGGCPCDASYGSLIGRFVCATTTPPTCGVPVGTTGVSSLVLSGNVRMAVSDGTTMTTYATSIGGGGNAISLPSTSGSITAAGDSSFIVVDVPDFGTAAGITPDGGYISVGSLNCPGGNCIWVATPNVGGGTNPSDLKGSGPVTGSYTGQFFYNGSSSAYDIPMNAASVWSFGTTSGSVKWCIYIDSEVMS